MARYIVIASYSHRDGSDAGLVDPKRTRVFGPYECGSQEEANKKLPSMSWLYSALSYEDWGDIEHLNIKELESPCVFEKSPR